VLRLLVSRVKVHLFDEDFCNLHDPSSFFLCLFNVVIKYQVEMFYSKNKAVCCYLWENIKHGAGHISVQHQSKIINNIVCNTERTRFEYHALFKRYEETQLKLWIKLYPSTWVGYILHTII